MHNSAACISPPYLAESRLRHNQFMQHMSCLIGWRRVLKDLVQPPHLSQSHAKCQQIASEVQPGVYLNQAKRIAQTLRLRDLYTLYILKHIISSGHKEVRLIYPTAY